jgi:hypothetical protein
LLVPEIFSINQADLAWTNYQGTDGPSAIRFKALTAGTRGVPPVQYIEYGPGQTDPMHRHEVGEFFIVASGDLTIAGNRLTAGGVAYIPAETDYAAMAGAEGAIYFRVVVG